MLGATIKNYRVQQNLNLKEVAQSNFIISVGSALKSDNPNARYALNNSLTVNKGAALYFHPVSDTVIVTIRSG